MADILRVLRNGNFQETNWFDLGIFLGLKYGELEKIDGLRKCLALWLRNDIEASWEKLADAVDESGDSAAAAHISKIMNH